jgi:hypothetical protein
MAIVRKVLIDDFEATYLLLKNFNNDSLTKEDRKRLFVDHWKSDAGFKKRHSCGTNPLHQQPELFQENYRFPDD